MENIVVHVRVRPLNPKESNQPLPLRVQPPSLIQIVDKGDSKDFHFDSVFGSQASQIQVFEKAGQISVQRFLEGYNCSIFTYGQTGSGKTYTILGHDSQEQMGLLPRSVRFIFDRLAQDTDSEFLVRCSFIQIYNESVNDLLNSAGQNLQIREDLRKGVHVQGCVQRVASNWRQALLIVDQGKTNRKVAATEFNPDSSRSHSVFVLYCETRKTQNGIKRITNSKYCFIDLAGSERVKLSNTAGDRLKQGCNINRSLSVLGQCITSLVQAYQGKTRYIHYRDSKLTFLLKDSLGGNSKTSIMANVSPSSSALPQTVSTLSFVRRAKLIKTKASINQDHSGSLQFLKAQIRRLKEQNLKLKASNVDHSNVPLQSSISLLQAQRILTNYVMGSHDNQLRLKTQFVKLGEQLQQTRRKIAKFQQVQVHLRTIITLYSDKVQRIRNGQPLLSQVDESLKAHVADLNNSPYMMSLIGQNLELRAKDTAFQSSKVLQKMNSHLIQLSNVENFLRENMKQQESIKRSAELQEKLKTIESICQDLNRCKTREQHLQSYNQQLLLQILQLRDNNKSLLQDYHLLYEHSSFRLQALRACHLELQSKLADKLSLVKDYQRIVCSLRQQLDFSRRSLHERQKRIQKLDKLVVSLEQSESNLNSNIDSISQVLKQMNIEKQQLDSLLANLQQQNCLLSQRSQETGRQLELISQKYNLLHQSHQGLTIKFDFLSKSNQTSLSQLSSTRGSYQSAVNQLEKTQVQLQSSKLLIQSLNSKLTDFQSISQRLQAREKSLAVLQVQITGQKARSAELQRENNHTIKAYHQSLEQVNLKKYQINKLTSNLHAKEELNQDLKERLDSSAKRFLQLQENCQSLKDKVHSLNTQLSQARLRFAEQALFQQQIRRLQTQLELKQLQLDKEQDKYKKNASLKVQNFVQVEISQETDLALANFNSSLQEQLHSLRQANSLLIYQKQQLLKSIQSASKNLQLFQEDKLKQSEQKNKFEEKLQNIESDLKFLKGGLELNRSQTQQNYISELKNRLQERNYFIQQLQEKLNKKQTSRCSIQQEEKLRARVSALASDLRSLQEQKDFQEKQLLKELSDVRVRSSALQSQIKQLQSKISIANRHLQTQRQEKQSLKQTLEDLNNKFSVIDRQKQDLIKEMGSLKVKLSERQSKNLLAQSSLQTTLQEIQQGKQLKEECKTLKIENKVMAKGFQKLWLILGAKIANFTNIEEMTVQSLILASDRMDKLRKYYQMCKSNRSPLRQLK